MTQAFLMHMDQLDRILELELTRLLDPIVRAPVPPRRRRRGGLTVIASDVAALVEPVPVVVPIVTPVS
jgi:hypothetical protein